MNPVKTILILAANPKDTRRVRLDEEVREIEEGLRRSKNRDQFNIQSKWAVRIKDLYRALLDHKPQIVHFCGHGDESGLMVEGDDGKAIIIETNALSELFELFPQIECVLLNACYSKQQAEAISKHIKYVIGMEQNISDTAARTFAIGFYDALGAGRSVEEAFKLGKTIIHLSGIPEYLTPILLINKQSIQNEKASNSDKIEREVQEKPAEENEGKENDKIKENQIEKSYDVFLCHNSEDKQNVEKIASKLEGKGIKTFLDKWCIIPGCRWQDELGNALNNCKICAVFFGPSELGPWQHQEMQLFLDKCVRDKTLHIIPVLLPGSRESSIPPFLQSYHRVDSRKGLDDDDALWRLECGIQGRKPGSGRPETLEEEAKVFNGDTENQGKIKHLDGYVESFQNRDEERNELTEFFYPKQEDNPQRAKTMIISGFPGIGKSALVADIINKNDSNQEKTIYFHKNINFDIVFERCLEKLNEKERKCIRSLDDERHKRRLNGENSDIETQELMKQLIRNLSKKGYVIVLNNMEELVREGNIKDKDLEQFIDESLKPGYTVKFLITSYEKLFSYKDKEWPLGPLDVNDCIEILKQQLENNKDEWGFSSKFPDESELSEVVRTFNCIPLAIDLIVLALNSHRWSWNELKNFLVDGAEPFVEEDSPFKKMLTQQGKDHGFYEKDSEKIGEIFTRLFKKLYEQLSREQQVILEILAVFEKAKPEAIHFVSERIGWRLPEEKKYNLTELEKVKTNLSELSKGQLIGFDQSIEKFYFRYDLARQYALFLIDKEENYTRQDIEGLSGNYYYYKLFDEKPDNWKAKPDINPYLQAARHYVTAKNYEQLARCSFFSKGPLKYLIRWGEYREIINLFERIPEESIDGKWRGYFLIYLGIAYLYTGKLRKAKEILEKAQECREVADNKLKSDCFQSLGNCLGQLGQIDNAIEHVKQCLKIIEQLEDSEKYFSKEDRGLAYHNLGYWYTFKGREKLVEAESSLKRAEELGKGHYYHSSSLVVLGDIYLYQEKFNDAIEKYYDALESAEEENSRRTLYDAQCGIGSAYLVSQSMNKDIDIGVKKVLKHLEQAIEVYKKISLDLKTYKAHLLSGMLYWTQNRSDEAIISFDNALRCIEELIREDECFNSQSKQSGFEAGYCKSLAYYGLFLYGKKEKIEVKRSVKAALRISSESGIIERMDQLFGVFGVDAKDFLKKLSQEL